MIRYNRVKPQLTYVAPKRDGKQVSLGASQCSRRNSPIGHAAWQWSFAKSEHFELNFGNSMDLFMPGRSPARLVDVHEVQGKVAAEPGTGALLGRLRRTHKLGL